MQFKKMECNSAGVFFKCGQLIEIIDVKNEFR